MTTDSKETCRDCGARGESVHYWDVDTAGAGHEPIAGVYVASPSSASNAWLCWACVDKYMDAEMRAKYAGGKR